MIHLLFRGEVEIAVEKFLFHKSTSEWTKRLDLFSCLLGSVLIVALG